MSTSVFSIHGLINWLERQDPETEYDYTLPATCLLTAYFKSHGVRPEGAFDYGPVCSMTAPWAEISDNKVGVPNTYGAALARAKSIVAET